MQKSGIYVHIPFCKRKCDYCSFVSTSELSLQNKYFHRLKAEISACDGVEADTVYFGGGTPSVAFRGFLTQIFNELNQRFDLTELNEFTVECNPESVSYAFLSECKHLGVNRLSMGLQSASDVVLKGVGRVHDAAMFVEAVRRAKSFGIDNISADLMLGLPNQTEDDVVAGVEILDRTGITHASVYSLSVEDGTPLSRSGYTVDDDFQADLYALAVSELKKYGYERYETSNFARNGKRAIHNVKYWTGADYYGFGVAAHSLINGVRCENTSDINEYISGATLKNKFKLSACDEREEFIMLRLRMDDGIDFAEYTKKFAKDLLVEKVDAVNKLLSLGLIEIKDKKLKTSEKGVYLLNSIITELL